MLHIHLKHMKVHHIYMIGITLYTASRYCFSDEKYFLQGSEKIFGLKFNLNLLDI